MEVRDWASAIALVRESVGVSLVPGSALPEKRKGSRIVRLHPRLYRRFGLKASPAREPSRYLLLEMAKQGTRRGWIDTAGAHAHTSAARRSHRQPFCALVGRSTEVRLSSKADVRLAAVINHHGPEADDRPPSGVRSTGRRSVVQTSRLQEGQQVCVDHFRLRGRHAVWEVLVGLKRPVF
jgi:hypothetical protein